MLILGLAKPSVPLTLFALYRPRASSSVLGLVHAECLTPMTLGSSPLEMSSCSSTSRQVALEGLSGYALTHD